MKLKLYTATALVAMLSLASCAGDDNKDYVDKSIMPTAEEKAASEKAAAEKAALNTNMPNQSTMPSVPGQTTVPVNMPQQPQTMNVNPQMVTQTQAPIVTAPGMNPPHGQPGHRCDIAVGAPLNSKPAPATTTGTTVSGQPKITMTEVPNKVKTLPGMNPPHGEPGHRCDIAVGAPLNSKPATVSTVTTATAPASIAPPPLLTAPKTDSAKN